MKDRFDPSLQLLQFKQRRPENPDEKAKGHFPSWLHLKMPQKKDMDKTNSVLETHKLHTVCEEAKCPNRFECFSQSTATFLALGKACTRACGFCSIDFSKSPPPPSDEEPMQIAESTLQLGLKHVVITMVARDDLPDGGASHLVKIMQAVRAKNKEATIELLTSDFAGNFDALDIVLNEKPEIFNYNIETVKRLTKRVRHKATYERTLALLSHAKASQKSHFVKSGLMLGLGETEEEVKETIKDLYTVGCDLITIGQYLQPERLKLPVQAFITPEQFKVYEEYGHTLGVHQMFSGPFVRSSYNAGLLKEIAEKRKKDGPSPT